MKIVLISPKGPLYRHKGGIFKKSLRYQPLTLTTLAALIPPELNASVELIDEGIQEIPNDLQADLIGMTVITGTAKRSYALARRFRDRSIPVVLGGPHVTLLPEEALENADAICSGYSEESWPRLLRDFAAGRLQRHYRQDSRLSLGENLPFPHRERFDSSNFLTQAVFEATRSCAHDCEFCVAPAAWGRQQLQRPVEWVIEDIRRVGQKKILFVDLNLVSDLAYAKQLFQALIPLNVQWYGLSTVIIGHDPALMELMARSGCKGLLLGLETLSEAGLKETGKRFNSSIDYRQLIGDLHQLGIAVQGCFVFGLDDDTPDVFDATVQLALDAAIDLPRFAVLTPFPGTPLFHRLEAEERILNRDWEQYDGQHVVFQPQQMSVQALAEGHERAWKAAYRWGNIGKRLWRAGNLKPLAISANLGYRFYAHNLQRFYTCDLPIHSLLPNPRTLWQPEQAEISTSQSSNRSVCGG
ncbi:MAG: radical SAM protein [Pseudomonadota bacterium]